MIAGAGRKHDAARVDAVQGDRGEVGAGPDAGRDDGYGLAAGDEVVFVFDGFDEGPTLIADIEKGHYFDD